MDVPKKIVLIGLVVFILIIVMCVAWQAIDPVGYAAMQGTPEVETYSR